MWENRKRLLVLLGLAVALVGVYVLVHGLPGGASPAVTGPARKPPPLHRPDEPAKEHSASPDDSPKAEAAETVLKDYRRVLEMSRRQDPKDLPVLKQAVREAEDWRTRLAGVTGVGRLGAKGDPELLTSVLAGKAENPEVRAAAAEQLGAMRWVPAGPALIDAMSEDSIVLRATAGVALRKIMGVHYGYRADAPPQDRQKALDLLRTQWPVFHAYWQSQQRR
jgi:HEAT repeat protein